MKFNSAGDLDFVAENKGILYQNVAVDEQNCLIVPLSLSTELNLYTTCETEEYVLWKINCKLIVYF